MRAERIVRKDTADHDRKQDERYQDVRPNDPVLVFTVHEDGDNEARFHGSDQERADDIPFAKVNLSGEHRDNGEHKKSNKHLEKGALRNYVADLVVAVRM